MCLIARCIQRPAQLPKARLTRFIAQFRYQILQGDKGGLFRLISSDESPMHLKMGKARIGLLIEKLVKVRALDSTRIVLQEEPRDVLCRGQLRNCRLIAMIVESIMITALSKNNLLVARHCSSKFYLRREDNGRHLSSGIGMEIALVDAI